MTPCAKALFREREAKSLWDRKAKAEISPLVWTSILLLVPSNGIRDTICPMEYFLGQKLLDSHQAN